MSERWHSMYSSLAVNNSKVWVTLTHWWKLASDPELFSDGTIRSDDAIWLNLPSNVTACLVCLFLKCGVGQVIGVGGIKLGTGGRNIMRRWIWSRETQCMKIQNLLEMIKVDCEWWKSRIYIGHRVSCARSHQPGSLRRRCEVMGFAMSIFAINRALGLDHAIDCRVLW